MKTINELMKVFKVPKIYEVKKIKFSGVENKNVYNTTLPFKFENETYIIGRVEDLEKKISYSKFFKKVKSSYVLDKSFKFFKLEDPFITKIKNYYVIGGVEIKVNKFGKWKWRTVFYFGRNLRNLKRLSTGPWGMKDIRLTELPSGKIGVLTRPQGKIGGRGKIGYCEINSLSELNPRKIARAKLIKNFFAKGEWGGANDLVILKTGKIGVLGHIAKFDIKKYRHYYPIVFAFDPVTRKSSTMRIITIRSSFPKGKAKRPDLYGVIFPGGITREKNNKATIYAGIGDAQTYKITIDDPFKYYEDNDEKIFG
jgi:hypothetical protein